MSRKGILFERNLRLSKESWEIVLILIINLFIKKIKNEYNEHEYKIRGIYENRFIITTDQLKLPNIYSNYVKSMRFI